MKTLLKNTIAHTLAIAVMWISSSANAQSVIDYSQLPETITTITIPDANILVIIDNSTSMRRSVSGDSLSGGVENPQSRSYILRSAVVVHCISPWHRFWVITWPQ